MAHLLLHLWQLTKLQDTENGTTETNQIKTITVSKLGLNLHQLIQFCNVCINTGQKNKEKKTKVITGRNFCKDKASAKCTPCED
jgi:hypothetical protein